MNFYVYILSHLTDFGETQYSAYLVHKYYHMKVY
jgi:hypothetical protein